MTHVDTSILIAAWTGPRAADAALSGLLAQGEKVSVSAVALYEWWRGPRTPEQLDIQRFLLPAWEAAEFGAEEAEVAARLYRSVRRPRTREIDLAIAACAITHEATLWTLNIEDFEDIPGLSLLRI